MRDIEAKLFFQNMLNTYGINPQELWSEYGGYKSTSVGSADFLRPLLQGYAKGDSPALKNIERLVQGRIRRRAEDEQRRTAEYLSASGMGKSGIGVAARSKIAGQEYQSLSDVTDLLAQHETEFRNRAIQSLLGLDSLELQNKNLNIQAWQNVLSSLLGQQNIIGNYIGAERQAQATQDAGYYQFLGELLGGIAKIAAPKII